MAMRPLEQFEISRVVPLHLGATDISFTNSAVMMVVGVALITILMTWAMRPRALVPGRWQSVAEMAYEFVHTMVRDNAGHDHRESMKFFPFVFSLFMFILFGNLLGMIPYTFTFTSHIIVTFGMALVVFIGVTIVGLARHGLHFFSFFVPEGSPPWLLPLIVPIEVLSYFTRPISLSVRLFANMMAGHTIMAVFAGFAVMLGVIGGLLPLAFLFALTGLEILVAVLQAYVFSILTCLYIRDALDLH